MSQYSLYDRLTENLLTGDSLYSGLLAVEDINVYTASAQRLADFASDHPVAHVPSTHIERNNLPYLDFGRGTIYQIDEAPLELTRARIRTERRVHLSAWGEQDGRHTRLHAGAARNR